MIVACFRHGVWSVGRLIVACFMHVAAVSRVRPAVCTHWSAMGTKGMLRFVNAVVMGCGFALILHCKMKVCEKNKGQRGVRKQRCRVEVRRTSNAVVQRRFTKRCGDRECARFGHSCLLNRESSLK